CSFDTDQRAPEMYTLSLHDALPIFGGSVDVGAGESALITVSIAQQEPLVFASRDQVEDRIAATERAWADWSGARNYEGPWADARSEEHTSELQSQSNLVCRLLLEKK